MLEAVFKTPAMMIVNLILILRINVFPAYLPEERMEFIFVSVLLKIVEQLNFFAICLEIGPNIPVDGDNHLALQVLRHTENIYGSHLILHADGIFSKGAECYINVMIFAVFCKVNGEMGVSGVVNVSAGSLYEVVHCLFIHIGRADSGEFFSILSGRIRRNKTGSVKAVQAYDLDIL